MNIQKLETLPPPPGVFNSLKAGFDIVTNRVALILLPLCLDLFLWLGPHLSVNELLSPYFKFIFEQARRGMATSDLEGLAQNQAMILERLQDYNLLGLLSKGQLFPIGVSSLSAQTLPVGNPFGVQNVVIVSSMWIMLGLVFVLVPLGWTFGSVYFRQVAVSILGGNEAGISIMRAVVQTFLLSVTWLVGMVIVFVPLFFVLALLALISPSIANIALLLFLFLSLWLVVPFFFTPHGIFVRGQNALYSIYSSLRMVRFSLPTSGMFVLSVFFLSSGMDLLWRIPKNDSWLTVVGFAGHAFITTALLAASIVYYRDMNNWLKNVYERFQQFRKTPSSTV